MWQDYNRPTPQQDEQSLAEMPQLIPIIIVEVYITITASPLFYK